MTFLDLQAHKQAGCQLLSQQAAQPPVIHSLLQGICPTCMASRLKGI